MKALILLKAGEENLYVVRAARRLLSSRGVELRFVHVVRVPGDIPITMDGRVPANCTEFDLSPYHRQAAEDVAFFRRHLTDDEMEAFESAVGQAEAVVRHESSTWGSDLIVSGSHATTQTEDLFSTTFADNLVHSFDDPVLLLRPDHEAHPDNAALVCHFDQWPSQDVDALRTLLDGLDTTPAFACVMGRHDDVIDELETRMTAFAETLGVVPTRTDVLDVADVRTGVTALDEERRFDILILQRPDQSVGDRILHGDALRHLIDHGHTALLIL